MNRTVCTCAAFLVIFACPRGAGLCPGAEPSVGWDGLRIEVNAHGNLGHIYVEPRSDEDSELLRRAEASGARANIWRVALVLVPTLDVTWKDFDGTERHTVAVLTPEQMDNARRSFERLARRVHALSGGWLAWETHQFVFPESVVYTTPPEEKGFFFIPPLKEQMVAAFPGWKPREFDSVICVFPPGDMPLDAFGRSWGQLHGPLAAGDAMIAYVAERLGPDGDMSGVMEHEWLHQAESVMMDNLGYVGLPNLHDAGLSGYRGDDAGLPGWTAWNRDLMRRLYRPAMWAKADMNRKLWSQPAPTFEGGFVVQWLVRGPFSNRNADGMPMIDHGLDTDFLDAAGAAPESSVLPAPTETAEIPIKDNALWRALDKTADVEPLPDDASDQQRSERAAQEGIVDFGRAFDPNTCGVAYAHVYVKAERTEEVVLWLGSDDGVKVYLNGLLVHRNRIDRGVVKDQDRVPVLLKRGWNRLLIKVDQGEGGWGFSARFSTTDGQAVAGLMTALELPNGATTERGALVPVVWNGRLYAWNDVKDDPWALLPRLDEPMLRAMTGLEGIRLDVREAVIRLDTGGSPRVVSPMLGAIDATDRRLNNQLTYANESLAWIRYYSLLRDARFAGDRRDLLLVRWDLIDAWMDWLETRPGAPPRAMLAGTIAVQRQVAYVVYTDLGERAPSSELDLVPMRNGGLVASVTLDRAESLTGKTIEGRLFIENTNAEPATLTSIAVTCAAPGIEPILKSPITEAAIAPGGNLSQIVPLLRVVPNAGPGPKLARVVLKLRTAHGSETLETWVAVHVERPVDVELLVDGPSIVRSGTTRRAALVLTNNAAHLGAATWRVSAPGVTVKPASGRTMLKPLPRVTTLDLTLAFRAVKRTGSTDAELVLDVAERTVPDSRATKRLHVGGRATLFRFGFEKGLENWRPGAGLYTIEHVRGRGMRGKGHALIKDGGGSKFGRIVIFGPDEGEEPDWGLSYGSDEYPTIEFKVALQNTGNVGLVIQADGRWFVLMLSGVFIENYGSRTELARFDVAPNGETHDVTFSLDEALDAALGPGNHAVQQIWIGDTKSHASNQWRDDDVGTIMIDDFVVR
ncbi:MAG: hypothetical protein JW889_03205 [Verrucomicrobia bacterium]|nr:hypothetical protein [Verrucomicrobiota bacterium]